jgi:hypothetical protein
MRNPIESSSVKKELDFAVEARQAGKEGRARVCARRAAGWAVVIYRRKINDPSDNENALTNLTWLRENHPQDAIQRAAARLITRVGEDYRLPHSQDPLKDAELIIAEMLE